MYAKVSTMTSQEIRAKYLKFFEERGHKIVPSASLVPDNDPTTLFTGSGMQPILPYLLGQIHPQGTRIVDSQKSFRTVDIEEVGDNRHTTFFEMLGNWSFGDYFQEEQLSWIFEFLTSELKLDPKKLFVTIFNGDEENNLLKDTNAGVVWQRLFKEKGIDAEIVEMGTEEQAAEKGMGNGRIFYYGAKNWWSRAGVPNKMPIGEPGGPDSEMFYLFEEVEHDTKFGRFCHPNCDCGRYLEIGNSVFMQYLKVGEKKFEMLPKKNIDFGGGFERIAMAALNSSDIFGIDILKGTIEALEKISGKKYSDPLYKKSFRIIADHTRASVFLIGDGVIPSSADQGYFVRRLLRRAVRQCDVLGIKENTLAGLVDIILSYYIDAYPETFAKKDLIKREISTEEEKFRKTLKDGLKQFEKGEDPFILFSTYGFPIELTQELAKEKNVTVDLEQFNQKMKEHQDLSRAGSEQKFKGGLADTSEQSVRYHTATHLLHYALRTVLGPHVEQKGSNITPERLRFDFAHPTKMTDEEKKKVEDIVNEKIQAAITVENKIMPKDEAIKAGALHFFNEKYPDQVSVYFIGDSIEFCGGPHVKNTKELGVFKIAKEEAVSAGVRRIKATLS